MGNTFGSINNAAGILKIYYQGPIVSQFNDKVPFYKHIARGNEKYNGLQVNRPLKVLRNPGIGATSDGGALPVIGKQTVQQAIIACKFNYLRFGVTGPLLKASQGDKGSFTSILTYEMQEGLLDTIKNVNRQLSWNGDGKLATVSANAVASNVVTVTGRESTEAGNKFLAAGYVVDFVNNTTGVVSASAVTINAISGTTTATLTLSNAVTVGANDFVVLNNSYNMEIQGILTAQDGGTSSIYGIDRSTYPVYQGNALSNNGNQMTLDFLQQMYNQIGQRGGSDMDYLMSDYDSQRYYNKLLVADKRFAVKVAGDGTFSDPDKKYLEFAGVPWIADPDAPTRVFMIDSSTYKKYILSELEFADDTGAVLIAQNSADAFEARLRLFCNLFPEKPASSAVGSSYISP